MKKIILLVTFLCYPFLSSCTNYRSAVASSRETQASDYEVVSMVTLNVGNGTQSQATIENLKDSIKAVAGEKPRSKLVIRNLSNGRVIYEEECGDSSVSYPGFDIGHGAGLVMMTRGGSGDGISVYEVTDSNARPVLAEAYRAGTIMVPNDELGGDVGFLIVDAEHATDPLTVRRYQYSLEKKQFVLTGRANFAQLLRITKAQFK